jgi:flagellar motility protein MotE (MotC chaperone)
MGMKLIQTSSPFKFILFHFLLGLIAGFPIVLANEDKHKPEESKSKAEGESKPAAEGSAAEKSEDKSVPEGKNKKSWNYSKIKLHKEVNAAGETEGSNTPLSQAKACLVDYSALDDLKRARLEIDERSKDLATREAGLKVREQVIAGEVQNLEKIRDEIAKKNEQKTKENEARVNQLVQTLLTMNPKSASKVLSDMEDSLAVLAMSQMDTPRLAKIMNNMDPARSAHLSEQLAGLKKTKDLVALKKGEH